eukprot:TRINITY_DN25448_c0_g2_i1.p1 TRINITY_DN25448_c0_g2~~TRINITY_DN25448_c0_g2_i1.p1  ORF type:complete len:681 (+),score=88.71 TRINITY_DN25448_c0_g2_i1:129-2171(+)
MSTVDLPVIGNGVCAALVDRVGRIVWFCLQRFDGDPIFNCLLNNNSDETGFYDIVLEDFDRAEQSFLGNSSVLVTRLYSCNGDSVEIHDFAPCFHDGDDVGRPLMVIRQITRVEGEPRVMMRVRPTFQYNSAEANLTPCSSHHLIYHGVDESYRLTTNASLKDLMQEKFTLVGGEPVYIVLGRNEHFECSTSSIQVYEEKTLMYWEKWSECLILPVSYQEDIVRAAMTISMLQIEKSGGLVASLTMGIPLGPVMPPTKDARVCRLLDECLAVPFLLEIGLFDMCRKFMEFAKERCFQEGTLQYAFTPSGEVLDADKEWAPCLAGYRGLGELQAGGANYDLEDDQEVWAFVGRSSKGVTGKTELSGKSVVYSLLVFTLSSVFYDVRLSTSGGLRSTKLFEKLESYAMHACDNFDRALQRYTSWRHYFGNSIQLRRPRCSDVGSFFEDDLHFFAWKENEMSNQQGMEETNRQPPSVHTLSSALCWSAADRLRKCSELLNDSTKAEYWKSRSVHMHEAICLHGWSESREAFTSFWGGDLVGPSMLRLGELGFIANIDPRFTTTLRGFEADFLGIECSLGSGGSSRSSSKSSSSSATDSREEGPKEPSACFRTNTLLWYCEALRSTGSVTASKRLLDSLLSCSKYRGVLSEAIDLKTGELWGNTPCVATLLALIRVASRSSRYW